MRLTASDKQDTNYEAPYYAVLYIAPVTPHTAPTPPPPLRPRYFRHDPVLKHPLPLMWETKFHANKKLEENLQLRILNITVFVKCVSDVKEVSNKVTYLKRYTNR